jgi:hypothetical protein
MQKTPKINNKLFECKCCDFICSKKSDWERHISRPRHLMAFSQNIKTPIDNNLHICITCGNKYLYLYINININI